MNKIRILFFMMCGFSGMGFAGEDAVFDFTDDRLISVDDSHAQPRQDSENDVYRDLLLERRNLATASLAKHGGQTTLQKPLDTVDALQDNLPIVDTRSLEQEVSPRDRAMLDALNNDRTFFRDLNDEYKKTTPAEFYRNQLSDCRELVSKSADAVRQTDRILYKAMEPKFLLAQKELTDLMVHADALQEREISALEGALEDLKLSIIHKITGHLFKVLILDALQIALRKLSHVRATLVPVQKKYKKKERHSGKKDSREQIIEAPYADY